MILHCRPSFRVAQVRSRSVLGVCAVEKNPALHIDAKRCILTTYRGHNGLKAFYRAGS